MGRMGLAVSFGVEPDRKNAAPALEQTCGDE